MRVWDSFRQGKRNEAQREWTRERKRGEITPNKLKGIDKMLHAAQVSLGDVVQ